MKISPETFLIKRSVSEYRFSRLILQTSNHTRTCCARGVFKVLNRVFAVGSVEGYAFMKATSKAVPLLGQRSLDVEQCRYWPCFLYYGCPIARCQYSSNLWRRLLSGDDWAAVVSATFQVLIIVSSDATKCEDESSGLKTCHSSVWPVPERMQRWFLHMEGEFKCPQPAIWKPVVRVREFEKILSLLESCNISGQPRLL